jgi:hypothetical protein
VPEDVVDRLHRVLACNGRVIHTSRLIRANRNSAVYGRTQRRDRAQQIEPPAAPDKVLPLRVRPGQVEDEVDPGPPHVAPAASPILSGPPVDTAVMRCSINIPNLGDFADPRVVGRAPTAAKPG